MTCESGRREGFGVTLGSLGRLVRAKLLQAGWWETGVIIEFQREREKETPWVGASPGVRAWEGSPARGERQGRQFPSPIRDGSTLENTPLPEAVE